MENIIKDNIKHSWRDVTINEYFKLREKIEEATSDYEKEIIKIAFTYGLEEDDIWNKRISDVKNMQKNTYWLSDISISKDVKFKKILIEDVLYDVNADMQSFTVAQYIDFQTFFPKRVQKTNYIGNILACFITPKNHKYGEGYDVQELVKKINENVDIKTANEMIFFFLKRYLHSIKVMHIFFNWQMKILKMLKMKKHKEKIEKLEKMVKEMEENISAGLPLLTMYQN